MRNVVLFILLLGGIVNEDRSSSLQELIWSICFCNQFLSAWSPSRSRFHCHLISIDAARSLCMEICRSLCFTSSVPHIPLLNFMPASPNHLLFRLQESYFASTSLVMVCFDYFFRFLFVLWHLHALRVNIVVTKQLSKVNLLLIFYFYCCLPQLASQYPACVSSRSYFAPISTRKVRLN